MKVTFEFDDTDIYEKKKMERMIFTDSFLLFIFEFEQELRKKCKYGEPSKDVEDLWDTWHNMKPESVHLATENF